MGLLEREANGIVYLVPSQEGVVFTTRIGGISRSPYESLNLGYLTGDSFEDVTENRVRLSQALGIRESWVTGHQVHAANVLVAGLVDAGGPPPRPEADGVVTSERGLPVAVVAADCVPIAIVGQDRVGAIHAGWRSMCAGLISKCVEAVGSGASAWIGPSIGPCHYEVGPELIEQFRKGNSAAPDFSTVQDGSVRFDLRAAARWLLGKAGAVVVDFSDPPCTACDSRFFSYRREGRTGRQGLVVWRPDL